MNPKLQKIINFCDKYKECKKCTNCLTETKVFGRGNLNAKIVVIGEGPGKKEVESKIPFTGPAGELLINILSSIGIKRNSLYFTNIVICRTDIRNRTPLTSEVNNCRSRLIEELGIVQPKITLLVGSPALQAFFGPDYKISQHHGTWLTNLSEPCYYFFALFHPSWALHSSTEGERRARENLMYNDINIFRDELKTIISTVK